MKPNIKELQFKASESSGNVSAILMSPKKANWLLVLAHGAGASMRHPFMENLAIKLAGHGIATFRFNFPYMEKGRKAPGPPAIAQATIRAAIETAASEVGNIPILVGGKSYGGRMASLAAANSHLKDTIGLIYFGFPLHQMGKPSIDRAAHLDKISIPMLFLQGSRDKLADISLIKSLTKSLGKKTTLHEIEYGDHSFHVPKKLGRTDDEVMEELSQVVSQWTIKLKG